MNVGALSATIGLFVIGVPGSKKRSVGVWSWLSLALSVRFFGVCSLLSLSMDSVSRPTGSMSSTAVSVFSGSIFGVISFVSAPSVVASCVIPSASYLSVPCPLIMFPYKSGSGAGVFFPVTPGLTIEFAFMMIFPAPPF